MLLILIASSGFHHRNMEAVAGAIWNSVSVSSLTHFSALGNPEAGKQIEHNLWDMVWLQ